MTKFTSFLSLAELPGDVREIIELRQREIGPDRPLKIVALCKDLGISVGKGNEHPEKDEAYMPTGCHLLIAKDSMRYTIFYDSTESRNRRLYAVTHGLAHILLEGEALFMPKAKKCSDELVRARLPDAILGQSCYAENCHYRGGLSENAEWAANHLAGQILMPAKQIDQFITSDGRLGIRALAQRFGVSDSLATVRMGFPLK